MTPSIYINLEDGVEAIALRLQRQRSQQIVLVCPKQCHLFSDESLLKELKNRADALGKEVFILTMDKQGQDFARLAGFGIRQVPGAAKTGAALDIKVKSPQVPKEPEKKEALQTNLFKTAADELKNAAKIFSKKSQENNQQTIPSKPSVSPSVSVFQTKELPEPVETTVKDTIFPEELDEKIVRDIKKPFPWKKVLVFFTAFVLLLSAFVYFWLPEAMVVVFPKTDSVTREMEVSIGSGISQSDTDKLALPAVKISIPLNASSTYQTKGKEQIGTKASGTVKIYNFTKQTVNLKSSTTVLQANGQAYLLADDLVSVKPSRYSNNATKEVDPQSVGESVKIIAINGGEDANLPIGTRLEITNKVFGSKPQLLYAKTDSLVTGGVSRFVSIVSSQDILDAQADLKAKVLEMARQQLAEKGLTLLDNSFTLSDNGFITDKPVNFQSPVFSAQLNVTLTGLAYNAQDMKRLVFERVKKSISTDKTLISLPDDQQTFTVKTIDLKAEAAVVSVIFKGQALSSVSLSGIPSQLVNKSPEEVDKLLNLRPEIDHVEVTLAPSWQKNFPLFSQRIFIKISD